MGCVSGHHVCQGGAKSLVVVGAGSNRANRTSDAPVANGRLWLERGELPVTPSVRFPPKADISSHF